MKTMQRIRWLFGFVAAILFIGLTLGWFVHHEFMEKIRQEARHYGFNHVDYERLTLSKGFICLKNVHFKGKEHFIAINHLGFHFSLNSLSHKSIELIDIQGMRFDDSFDRVKSFFYAYIGELHEKIGFFRINVDGIGLVRSDFGDFLIPLTISFDKESHKKVLNLKINPLSNLFSGHFTLYGEKNGQDLKFELYTHHLKSRLEGQYFAIKESEIFFQPDPYQADSKQKYTLSTLINDGLIGISAENDASIPFDLNISTHFIIGNDIFDIQGDGSASFLGQLLRIHMITEDQKFKFSAMSEANYRNRFDSDSLSQERVKQLSGALTFKSHIELPIHEKGIDKGNLLSSLLSKTFAMIFSHEKNGTVGLSFNKFNIETDYYTVKSLNGDLNATLFPLKSRGIQKLDCEEIVLPSKAILKDVETSFSYDEMLTPKEIKASIFGGKIHLHSLQRRQSLGYRMSFDIRDMDMSHGLALLDIPSLAGKGIVQGRGQIGYDDVSGVNIVNARLSSQDKSGQLTYNNPEKSEKSLEESEDLAFQILENLNYTHFILDIVPENGKLQAFLEIMGYNPSVLSGHPFHFKIKTSGDLDQTLKNSLRNFRLPKTWKDFKKA